MMTNRKKNRQIIIWQKGFSLIEMLVYILILSVLSVFLVYSIISMIRSVAEISVSRSVFDGVALSLERITRESKNAYEVDEATSTLDVHPGRLGLLSTDNSGATTTVLFFVSNGNIFIKKGTGTAQSLLPERVTVGELIFRLATSTLSQAVKVELELTGSRGSVSRTERFYGSAQLRGY